MEIAAEKLDKFAQDFLRSWQAAYGYSSGSAKALSGPGQVAILIERVFSHAERKLARDQHGEYLLRQYFTALFDQRADQMAEHAQQTLGKTVRSQSLSINPIEDQILCIFTLG